MSKDTQEFEQEVEETTVQDDSLDETNKDAEEALESEESDDEVEATDASQEEPNYAELYESEQRAREKAEKLIVKMKRERKSQEVDDLDEEEEPELDDKITQAVRAEFTREVVDEMLGTLSSNENEKKLIRYHYENTINPSGVSRGSIEKDLRRAKLLANETLYSNKATELIEEDLKKASITNSSLGTNRDVRKPKQKVKLTAQERAILQRRGIDPETFTN